MRTDEAALEALRQEVKRNRQVVHPNILRVYDFIEEQDWAAIVMEHFEGESLAALRRKRPAGFFEVADVKPWLTQLSQTLEDAHKIQLCHRDIGPEDIFLEKDGRLLLSSFGISRCLRDALGRGAGVNKTLANLSPQHLDGQRATAADDVYATGVLVHELLAGQPPFTGDDLAEKIRQTPAPTMMERRSQLGKAGGPIPPGWEKVIAACLEKNPEQRPKSMSEFATRLGLDKNGRTAVPAPSVELPTVAPAIAAPISKAARPIVRESAPVVKGTPAAKPEPSQPPTVAKSEPTPPAVAPALAKKETAPRISTELKATKMASEPEEELEIDPAQQNAIPDHYPSLRVRRSGFPITGLAAGLLLLALSLYAIWPGLFSKKDKTNADPAFSAAARTDASELTPVTNPISEKAPVRTPPVADEAPLPVVQTPTLPTPAVGVPAVKREPIIEAAPPVVAAVGEKLQLDSAIMLAAKKATPVKTATPIPTTGPAAATKDSAVAAKVAELEAAKKAAEAAEKAHQDLLKQKSQAEAAIATATAALEEKTKAAAPLVKAAQEAGALKQQREEAFRAAELAAQEAQKAAAEKARLADEAKKAIASVEAESKEKLAAQQKAEKELSELKRTIALKEKQVVDVAKLAEEAKARRENELAAVKQTEQAVATAKIAAEEAAKKAAEEAAKMELVRKAEEERRAVIKKEMDDAKRAFDERMKALEDALKASVGSAPAPAASTPAPKPAAPVKPEPATPAPTAPAPATPTPSASIPAATPTPPAEMAKVEPKPAPVTEMAKIEPPKPAPLPTAEDKPAPAAAGDGFTNSLGMKFVRVGDVEFSIWQTRMKDFEVFANATALKSNLWRDPGFTQGPDHPVVNVTWQEAMLFCKWLTFKEQREGVLQASQSYRLPTDLEWSKAVGLPEESGKTPEARDMGVPDVYPWGNQWPPPAKAGNYTGEETGSDVAIKGYEDGFPWTAPVGSFPPNKYGLYDMGGNVWQWVMDSWSSDAKSKVLRGASWYNGALKLSLLSSCRVHAAQDSGTDNYGFRCVIATESGRAAKR